MRRTDRKFFGAGVDEEGTNFQGERFFVSHVGAGILGPLNRSPFSKSNDVRLGGSSSDRVKEKDYERQRYPETKLRETDHRTRVSRERLEDKVRRHKCED